MRYLQQDARAITGLVICAFGSAMPHVFQYFQGVVHQFVTFVPVDVDYHSNTTGIMLVSSFI